MCLSCVMQRTVTNSCTTSRCCAHSMHQLLGCPASLEVVVVCIQQQAIANLLVSAIVDGQHSCKQIECTDWSSLGILLKKLCQLMRKCFSFSCVSMLCCVKQIKCKKIKMGTRQTSPGRVLLPSRRGGGGACCGVKSCNVVILLSIRMTR